MQLSMYSLFDTKAQTFGIPFFLLNDAVAQRSFYQLYSDPQSTVHQFPSDFQLYRLGTFNDSDGKFDLLDQYVQILSGSSLPNGGNIDG